jgi:hypothetical protein
MTARRQWEKSAAILLLVWLNGVYPQAAFSAPLVINPATGLAISGFDPVAYFTEAKAEPGRAEFELGAEDAVWRFRNEGNRAAFLAHPEIYRPAFGGYDPVAVARERSVPGHSLIWAISGERLYLFYSEQSRAAFLANPAGVLMQAERHWPDVQKGIAR